MTIMNKDYEPLFTPWKIGNLEIKNRFVLTSMGGTNLLQFNLSPGKKAILESLCQDESTTMEYMNQTSTVRVRDYQESLVEGSEWLSSVDGLYECSVKVTEF